MMTKSAIRLIAALFILFPAIIAAAAGCVIKQEKAEAGPRNAVIVQEDEQSAALNQFNQLSEQLYAAVQEGNRQLAYTSIIRLEQAAAKAAIRKLGTVQGWNEFDNSVRKMKERLARKKTGSDDYYASARLKLAVDAVTRPDSPLWLQYYKVLGDDWTRMRQAWQSLSDSRVNGALASLHVYRMHVERLEIAALMGQKEKPLALLQAELHRTGQLLEAAREAGGMEAGRMNAAFTALEEAAQRLFGEALAAEAELQQPVIPFHQRIAAGEWLTLALIGGFVLLILAYSVWRKYAYEQAHGSPAANKGGSGRRWG